METAQCCPLGIHAREPYDEVSLLTKVLEILLRKPHETSIFLSKDIHQHIVLNLFNKNNLFNNKFLAFNVK